MYKENKTLQEEVDELNKALSVLKRVIIKEVELDYLKAIKFIRYICGKDKE